MSNPDARLLALVARSPGCTASWYAGMLKVGREKICGREARVYRPREQT